jgi:SAM-dependent methyltransferase
MPVFRIDNYLDGYRIRAQSEDVHEMAGRTGKDFLTDFVNRRILHAIQPGPEDVLVDIGCGDASLLMMARGLTQRSIGITSTGEEQRRLEAAFPGLLVRAGDIRSLPIESGTATKIVCNGVLAYLQYQIEVEAGLREIARIARPGATIWIGEVPDIDEYEHYGMYRGDSMVAFLWHLLTRNGVRSFLGMIRRWLKAVLGKEQIVLNSAGAFYITPEKMIALAQGCGLQAKSYSRSKMVDEQGNVTDSEFRYDYLFTL